MASLVLFEDLANAIWLNYTFPLLLFTNLVKKNKTSMYISFCHHVKSTEFYWSGPNSYMKLCCISSPPLSSCVSFLFILKTQTESSERVEDRQYFHPLHAQYLLCIFAYGKLCMQPYYGKAMHTGASLTNLYKLKSLASIIANCYSDLFVANLELNQFVCFQKTSFNKH